jgi:hypothetical protein
LDSDTWLGDPKRIFKEHETPAEHDQKPQVAPELQTDGPIAATGETINPATEQDLSQS